MNYPGKHLLAFTVFIILSLIGLSHAVSGIGSEFPRNGCPDLVDLIKKLTPLVVSISIERDSANGGTEGRSPDKTSLKTLPKHPKTLEDFETDSIGSGFFCDGVGHIVTNAHVVENADRISVTLSSGKVLNAKVVALHPKVDLALLKVNLPSPIEAVSLGSPDNVQVGEWVLAVGNPFGLGRTVTIGIVSGKGRFLGFSPDDNFIQTDASINPGNSGGPLFNMAGEVIGVNTAIISTGKGIGFSIPSNFIRDLMRSAVSLADQERGWLGIYVDDVDEEKAKSLGLKNSRGAVIDQVMGSTPAHKAGLRKGDLVIRADEKAIECRQDLSLIVSKIKPGNRLRMTVLRQDKQHELEVIVEPVPQ